jgi:hypothetical protein
MRTKQIDFNVPVLLIWLLLASLIFITMLNPERGLLTGMTALGVFAGLTCADKLHLI